MRRVLKWLAIGFGGVTVLFATLLALAVTGVIGPPSPSPEAIERSVDRTEARLEEARILPVAGRYGRELHWQSNGSMCGPASLVNVYRSFGETVADEDEVLEGTGKCGLGICVMGLTLDELAEVARSHGSREVTVLRDLDIEQFREHLRRSNDPAYRYVINFSREPIFGEGSGHHSPIGGYLVEQDVVVVLDVNEAYRAPWLVETERLHAAMRTLDGDLERGLLLIE